MAVELMSYRNEGYCGPMTESNPAQEAASAGFQNVEELIRIFSHQAHADGEVDDYKTIANTAVSKFKKFISLMDRTRTGHARYRRGPVISQRSEPLDQNQTVENKPDSISTAYYCLPPIPLQIGSMDQRKESTTTIYFPAANSSVSSLTGDIDGLLPSTAALGNGRPPRPSPAAKRKYGSVDDTVVVVIKKRKSTVKKVVRVPATGTKMTDIPADDFSWRKYGQKPIKGSPHPRGYYKCSNGKDCPARKHVERAPDDPTMLIVTYEDEHNHSCTGTEASPALVLESS
ncbi:probable WRKY transcription factor 7 [Actinidia eriantha]|uniref:probable WRKY transcription factor 7 n=1 Tax=Actinidia eriantha TaxID=165200 RepID=UPI002588992C|nr:probable WRKY transcription factor 7 [Actinidia eriantha]